MADQAADTLTSSSTRRPRRAAIAILTVLSVVLTVAATVMAFAQDRLFDADDFASTVGTAMQDPAVNEYLAEVVSGELVAQVPTVAITGPLLTDVTGSVLESDAAVGIVESSAREAHEVFFTGADDSVVLRLSDLAVSIQLALQSISPELAESIPDEVESLTVSLSSGEFAAGTIRLAEQLRLATIVLAVLAVVSMIALVVLESSLFRGFARLGLVLGIVGLFVVVGVAVGAAVLASYGQNSLEQAALEAAWQVVLGDLVSWGWVLVAAGALLSSIGWAVANVGNVTGKAVEIVQRLVLVADSGSRWANAARIIGLLMVALWALTSPLSLISAVVRLAGFALAVFVLAEVVDRLGLAERLKTAGTTAAGDDDPLSLRTVGTRFGLTALVLIPLGVGAVVLLANNDDASALADPDACNGHVELCDRRLDEVTMAAAHNSMSSTATDFYLPNHLSPMRAMLDQGVRGFMIDTVYGSDAGDGSVRTSLDLFDVDSLDDGARRAAEAVQARQSTDLGPESVYLCHGYCEIGAIDAVAELQILRDWLEERPREVVVLIVQDETEPEDTAAIFVAAGFEDLVLTQPLDEPLPTLGEMIDTGRRVFVMVENSGDGIDWLHPAFEFSQETPFSFASADEFSCDANRGEPDSPLFVVNHFITLANPANQTINDFDPLLTRAEQCRNERGQQPNLLSVDFVGQGDVMAVVDRLNGVD